MSPKQDATTKHLGQLMLANKLYIKCSDVTVTKVQYKGLKVKDLVRFAESKWEIDRYSDEYFYQKESNRESLYNFIKSLIQDEFKEFIQERIDKKIKN